MNSDTYRSETATGFATDDFVVNVDTQLPVTKLGSTYTAINDMWDTYDPVINEIVTTAPYNGQVMGFGNGMWDQNNTSNIVVIPNTISSKENLNDSDGANFYRNAQMYEGTLVYDLLAPTAATQNLDVITVFVDPLTHVVTDILPDPGTSSAAIWIDGERIEYRMKTAGVYPNTWELRLVMRGTAQTGITNHVAGSAIWIERDNIIPGTPDIDDWSAINTAGSYQAWNQSTTYYTGDIITYLGFNYSATTTIAPLGPTPNINPLWTLSGPGSNFTSVTSVPLGGLWYSQTPEAIFLKQAQGSTSHLPPPPITIFPVQLSNYGTPIIGGHVTPFPVQLKNSGIPVQPAALFPVMLTNYGTPIIGGPTTLFPVQNTNYGTPIIGGPTSVFPVMMTGYGTIIGGGPVTTFPVQITNG
jgi:hypothetical protein